ELASRNVPFYRRVTSLHENESKLADDFQLALRTLANPRDQLHMSALLKRWNLTLNGEVISESAQVVALMSDCARVSGEPRCQVIADAIDRIAKQNSGLNIRPAIEVLRKH